MTTKSNEEWKKILSPEAYHITREAGTEPPWTGSLLNEKTNWNISLYLLQHSTVQVRCKI